MPATPRNTSQVAPARAPVVAVAAAQHAVATVAANPKAAPSPVAIRSLAVANHLGAQASLRASRAASIARATGSPVHAALAERAHAEALHANHAVLAAHAIARPWRSEDWRRAHPGESWRWDRNAARPWANAAWRARYPEERWRWDARFRTPANRWQWDLAWRRLHPELIPAGWVDRFAFDDEAPVDISLWQRFQNLFVRAPPAVIVDDGSQTPPDPDAADPNAAPTDDAAPQDDDAQPDTNDAQRAADAADAATDAAGSIFGNAGQITAAFSQRPVWHGRAVENRFPRGDIERRHFGLANEHRHMAGWEAQSGQRHPDRNAWEMRAREHLDIAHRHGARFLRPAPPLPQSPYAPDPPMERPAPPVTGAWWTLPAIGLAGYGAYRGWQAARPYLPNLPHISMASGADSNVPGWELPVKALQFALRSLKLYQGAIDGVATDALMDAVVLFQRQKGLLANGTVSGRTAILLRTQAPFIDASGAWLPGVFWPAFAAQAAIPAALGVLGLGGAAALAISDKRGVEHRGTYARGRTSDASGAGVLPAGWILSPKNVQFALRSMRLYNGAIDGNVTDDLIAAVVTLQKRHGLAQDGIVNQATAKLLRGDIPFQLDLDPDASGILRWERGRRFDALHAGIGRRDPNAVSQYLRLKACAAQGNQACVTALQELEARRARHASLQGEGAPSHEGWGFPTEVTAGIDLSSQGRQPRKSLPKRTLDHLKKVLRDAH